MIDYQMMTYKGHYACFSCRKTIKRRLMVDIDRNKVNSCTPYQDKEAKCPDCGKRILSVGLDFASPKKNDKKAWEQAFCCFIEKLENIKKWQQEHLIFWKKVQENKNEDYTCSNKYWQLPKELKIGTRKNPKANIEKAISLWQKRVENTQEKIDYLLGD